MQKNSKIKSGENIASQAQCNQSSDCALKVISALVHEGPFDQRSLVAKTGCSLSSVHRVLDQLRKMNLCYVSAYSHKIGVSQRVKIFSFGPGTDIDPPMDMYVDVKRKDEPIVLRHVTYGIMGI